ncbi:hypothetical protein LCGC14_0349730 [marine sediment metagenome]|uniref:Uncharacterized protein n=1 Tax=marine sediment metagenome TaxID=412755 RepID=A0A0F9VYF3_9ZZZZ
MTTDTQGRVEEAVVEAMSDKIPAEAEMGRVKVISEAEKVQIWDTRTYHTGYVLAYMLNAKLRDIREDGSRRWTTKDPHQLEIRGDVKCLLHKDGEDRKHYNFLGLRVCKKDNIRNFHERNLHMLRKHPKEYDVIREEQKERKEEEDRALQRAVLGKMLGEAKESVGEESKLKADVVAKGKAKLEAVKAEESKAQATLEAEEEAPLYISDKDRVNKD